MQKKTSSFMHIAWRGQGRVTVLELGRDEGVMGVCNQVHQ